MLTKVTILDRIEVLSQKFLTLQVRYIKDRIIDDTTGEIVAEGTFWRVGYNPGDNIDHEDPQVQAIAAMLWTDNVKKAYTDDLAKHAGRASKVDNPITITETSAEDLN